MVNRILKISIIALLLGLIIYLVIDSLAFNGVRSFYCLSDDKCVTVWKKTNGEVFIIPDKYVENSEPSVSHIKTINKQFLTLYFSEEIPQKIVVRDQGNLESNLKRYTIEKREKGKWEFLEYSEEYKSILYGQDAKKFKDVKLVADYLTINIHENYATDKTGKKLK
jgi:hypothetical protein